MRTGTVSQRAIGTQLVAAVVAWALVAAPAVIASQPTLGGRVVGAAGAPVVGATVQVMLPGSDKVIHSTTTGKNGLYAVDGLDAGTYQVRLEPGSTGVKGATVTAQVGEKGLVVNWRASANEKPVVLAVPGQVGSEEDEFCSPVEIGDYEVNRCWLAGGVLLGAAAIAGIAVAATSGGGGGGGCDKTPENNYCGTGCPFEKVGDCCPGPQNDYCGTCIPTPENQNCSCIPGDPESPCQ